jgi:ABC-2 type transport system ATP-binding protein
VNAIETHGLTKKYKDITAVNGLELEVRQGELFALLGVNGAGKTTTIKMLSCLTKPTAGDALLLGKSAVREPAAVKGLIAVSPQETAVAPKLTVRENLELMAGIHGTDRTVVREKVQAMADRFGLDEVLNKAAGKLSGGWQRRLSIAMALILEPKILFLDEPTLGLDVLARSELWDQIRALKGEVTMILTTHYMEEAEALSDRIGVMGKGRLIRVGTAAELKAETEANTLEEAFIALAKEGKK